MVSDLWYVGDLFAAAARRFASELNGGFSSVVLNLFVVYVKMFLYIVV